MDDLPAPVVVEILSRVGDSTDLAQCRLASRTLRSLSYDVHAVSLVCSHDRFVRSRAPETRSLTVPFKTVVTNLASLLRGRCLESLSLAVEVLSTAVADGGCEFDESDELHLTAVDFVSRWLPGIGGRLISLTISDLWAQSCWRPSEVLALISNCCERLFSLELRNAWLSVATLKPMPSLSSLTLEFIRLEDEDLDALSACFPSLESLSLIGVGGLNEPKIRLPRLRTCRWTVSRVPLSVAIHAPDLTDLDLFCVSPRVLSLRTPSLRRLHLWMKQVGAVEVDRFTRLRSVRVECTSGLRALVRALAGCEAVEKAEVEAPGCVAMADLTEPVAMADLAAAFPCLEELGLGPGAWREVERSTAGGEPEVPAEWRRLRRLTVHLPRSLLFHVSSLSSVLYACGPLCEVVVLVHAEDGGGETMDVLVSMCRSSFPEVRWGWGLWRECFEGESVDLCRQWGR